MTTNIRYQNIPTDADGWPTTEGAKHTTDLIIDAMDEDARHPVTIGYWEARKELRDVHKRDGTIVQEWCEVPGQFVHAVRTIEFFFFDEVLPGLKTRAQPGVYFKGMDRCPRDDKDWTRFGPPRIRTVRADRITDITVHTKAAYRLKNQYFIDKVREHAEGQREPARAGFTVDTLTDDAIWHMIHLATDTDDAIKRAGLPARA